MKQPKQSRLSEKGIGSSVIGLIDDIEIIEFSEFQEFVTAKFRIFKYKMMDKLNKFVSNV